MAYRALFRISAALAVLLLVPFTATAQSADDNPVYVAQVFDDWNIQCRRVEGAADPCRMIQAVLDENGNQVSQITVQALPPGQDAVAAISFAAPLETFLPEGMSVKIDDGAEAKLPFEFCSVTGCFARVLVSPEQLDIFIKGGKVTMSLVPLANRTSVVTLEASLKGFTAGYRQLEFQVSGE